MALQAPGKQTIKSMIRGFTGANTRVDPTMLESSQLAQGVNVELHDTPGVIRARRGFVFHLSLSIWPSLIRLRSSSLVAISESAAEVFFFGSSTFTDAGTVDAGAYRSASAPTEELFIANGGNMERFITSINNWGIAAPTVAPTLGVTGTGLTGDYSVVYTYARKSGSTLVHESNPSPADTITLSNENINATATAPTDGAVTHIRWYRTVASGSTHLFEKEVADTTLNVTLDEGDGNLGSAVDEDNDRPPPGNRLEVLKNRIWLNDTRRSDRLWYSKKFFPEAFPAANFIDLGVSAQSITAIASLNDTLVVFTQGKKFRVVETDSNVVAVGGNLPVIGGSATDFVVFELPSGRGTKAYKTIVKTPLGLIYASRDGIFLTQADGSQDQLLSAKIDNIFRGRTAGGSVAIDFDYEENMTAAYLDNRYYLSYRSASSSDPDLHPSGTLGNVLENDKTVVINIQTGEALFWDDGFTALYTNEKTGTLYGAMDLDPLVQTPTILELEVEGEAGDILTGDETTDVSATVETARIPAVDGAQKGLFQWVRYDAKVNMNDTLTAGFYADGVLKQTTTITGDRTRQLVRLPNGTRGYHWSVIFSYTGKNPMELHGVETQLKTLASS